MNKLNLPDYTFKIKEENKTTKIFDEIRKKYVVLTPEEWVRQHLIKYLIDEKGYPKSLIAVEKGLRVNNLAKRTDILIYSREGKPILMVECKSYQAKVDQAVFDQASRYNIAFQLPYLVASNGLNHYCAKIDFKRRNFKFLNEIPRYEDLDF